MNFFHSTEKKARRPPGLVIFDDWSWMGMVWGYFVASFSRRSAPGQLQDEFEPKWAKFIFSSFLSFNRHQNFSEHVRITKVRLQRAKKVLFQMVQPRNSGDYLSQSNSPSKLSRSSEAWKWGPPRPYLTFEAATAAQVVRSGWISAWALSRGCSSISRLSSEN